MTLREMFAADDAARREGRPLPTDAELRGPERGQHRWAKSYPANICERIRQDTLDDVELRAMLRGLSDEALAHRRSLTPAQRRAEDAALTAEITRLAELNEARS